MKVSPLHSFVGWREITPWDPKDMAIVAQLENSHPDVRPLPSPPPSGGSRGLRGTAPCPRRQGAAVDSEPASLPRPLTSLTDRPSVSGRGAFWEEGAAPNLAPGGAVHPDHPRSPGQSHSCLPRLQSQAWLPTTSAKFHH